MADWADIRRRVLVEGVSKRQTLRETGMHWETLWKVLTHSEPPGCRQLKAQPKQMLGPYQERLEQILKADQLLPRKQRHTAKRVWERLKEAGFTGGYTVVKGAVRELTQRNQEVFVPLVHPPGEAQMDFGHALVRFVVCEQQPRGTFAALVLRLDCFRFAYLLGRKPRRHVETNDSALS